MEINEKILEYYLKTRDLKKVLYRFDIGIGNWDNILNGKSLDIGCALHQIGKDCETCIVAYCTSGLICSGIGYKLWRRDSFFIGYGWISTSKKSYEKAVIVRDNLFDLRMKINDISSLLFHVSRNLRQGWALCPEEINSYLREFQLASERRKRK